MIFLGDYLNSSQPQDSMPQNYPTSFVTHLPVMKSNPPNYLALVLVVNLAATGLGLARGGRHHRHEDRPARRAVKAYFQANVLPVLRQQRQKLEPQLTAPDRALLATYRTQLQALKEQGQALRRSIAPQAQPGTTGRPTLSQQQQVQELRSQAKTIMLSVAQLAQKYEAPITQLALEVQPQKEKWASDSKAIVIKNLTPEQQERMVAAGGRMPGRGGLRRFFRPARFLLMDPNAAAKNPARGQGSTRFYPNPVAATSQLEYEVKKAGPVTVDLLDSKGTKLRTLVTVPKEEKGTHTQQLELGDLPAGTYFYKITTKGSTETKRFGKEEGWQRKKEG